MDADFLTEKRPRNSRRNDNGDTYGILYLFKMEFFKRIQKYIKNSYASVKWASPGFFLVSEGMKGHPDFGFFSFLGLSAKEVIL